MLKEMMEQCCGTDGNPDFDEMVKYMEHHERARKYDTAGWALFFIWVGLAWMTDLGSGIGLLGIGVITLGGQAVRAYFNGKGGALLGRCRRAIRARGHLGVVRGGATFTSPLIDIRRFCGTNFHVLD